MRGIEIYSPDGKLKDYVVPVSAMVDAMSVTVMMTDTGELIPLFDDLRHLGELDLRLNHPSQVAR